MLALPGCLKNCTQVLSLMLILNPPVADRGKEIRALYLQIHRSETLSAALRVIITGPSGSLQADSKHRASRQIQQRGTMVQRGQDWYLHSALHLVDQVTLDN